MKSFAIHPALYVGFWLIVNLAIGLYWFGSGPGDAMSSYSDAIES